jgi:hypothetical protein
MPLTAHIRENKNLDSCWEQGRAGQAFESGGAPFAVSFSKGAAFDFVFFPPNPSVISESACVNANPVFGS